MTDDLEPLRRARPDRLLPDDPPDPETLAREKARLMSAITGPEGVVVHRRTPSIYPRLAYRDEVAALDFLTRAFGLVERRESRMEQPGGMLAWLEIGDGVVMIGRAGEERHGLFSPLDVGAPTAAVNVYVHDIDAHYHRAESEGAQIVTPLEDMFWGDRRYEALDLEGRIVVLSACQTASGAVQSGEGVLSLARAFFEAGAHAVVGSRWPLRDADAAALFDTFYRHLATGASLSEALKITKDEAYLAGRPAASWAGLVLLGNGDLRPFLGPQPSQGQFGRNLLLATLVVLVSLVVIRARRRITAL